MIGSGATFSDSSRRDSKRRRRVSERRRVFSRPVLTGPADVVLGSSSERRRSSNYAPDRADSPARAALASANDQTKITMKIQFYITLAPENEPLILDNASSASSSASATATCGGQSSSISQQQQQKRHLSSDSGSLIGESISDRLNRLNSSTRKRQQLIAMHQQAALDGGGGGGGSGSGVARAAEIGRLSSADRASFRSGSFSTSTNYLGEARAAAVMASRESGARSSTITSGIQDEQTRRFLQRQQQQQLRQASGSLTSNSASSLLGQHQTLMASSNNIRQRLEQREHIYFKRDGQRFGHEFTLKLAVDKNYRCLIKVRPLIPLQSISIHGHHVSFVDCSQTTAAATTGASSATFSGGSATSGISLAGSGDTQAHAVHHPADVFASNSTSASSGYASSSASAPRCAASATRHQSICGGVAQPLNGFGNHHGGGGRLSQVVVDNQFQMMHQRANATALNHTHSPLAAHRNSDISPSMISRNLSHHNHNNNNNHHHHHQQQQQTNSSASMSALSQSSQVLSPQSQRQLLKLQQHNQMLRHFSASHGSGSHLGSQLVYMFDWSASRFEVTKNKARTTVQTVLKFKNGELLSLPLQIKFYQPECRQHLSWGSQLHFIDYECQINSMGQIKVDRVQYY